MTRAILISILLIEGCSSLPLDYSNDCPQDVPVDYDRSLWGRWEDEDKDCQNTRQEILIRDSKIPVTLDDRGCKVLAGRWVDPYDGREITSPSKIDIDHIVALQDAHVSGGWMWSPEQKHAFANDFSNLVASSRSTNRSKGSKGPDEWLPPLETARCSYIKQWSNLKTKYNLSLSKQEYPLLSYMRIICKKGQTPPLPQTKL